MLGPIGRILAPGSSLSPLPSHPKGQWRVSRGARQLQWRVRAGFTPDFTLSPYGHPNGPIQLWGVSYHSRRSGSIDKLRGNTAAVKFCSVAKRLDHDRCG